MKLIINYDLINEIRQANTGFNLKRFSSKMVLFSGTITALNLMTLALGSDIHVESTAFGFGYATFFYSTTELVTKRFNKILADSRLNELASSLTKINIYTDLESIKNAHLYKTQYKIVHDDKTSIQQNKFIMLPTNGTFNADEVSLQQEHIIGSREYVLSMGEPKKAHSKVLSKAFARQI